VTVDLEIICVGNELLIGKILNTNAHWLGKESTARAVNVKRVTVIQDTVEEIANIIQEALARKPQFIITTGGLGPTFDDKTLEGIAKALDRKLEVNPKALEMVKQKCEQYAKKRCLPTPIQLTKPRVKMATIPENTQPVNNPVGTAPGVQVTVHGTMLFALPGVPSEMEAIFNETIAPMLKQAAGNLVFCEKSLFLDNIVESTLAPLIDKVMAEHKSVYIKSHPMGALKKPHIELHLTITANEDENPDGKLECAITQLTELIQEAGGETIRHN
jgi:nicotinamide-nucleotide amidase